MSKKSNKKAKNDEMTALATSVKEEMLRVREAFSAGPLFREPPAEQEAPVAVAAWAVLDSLEGVIEERKKAYRQHLLDYAKDNGTPTVDKKKKTPTGGQEVWIDSSKVVREHRQDKLPNDTADFRLMLAGKNISLSDLFDEVKTLVMNPSKLDFLIDSGRLDAKDLEQYKSTGYALKVKQSDIIEEFLDDMTNQLLGVTTNDKRLKSG